MSKSVMAALLALLILPLSVAAQEGDGGSDCGVAIGGCASGIGMHNFIEHQNESHRPDELGSGTFHGPCLNCVRNGQAVDAINCHPTCFETEEEQEEMEMLLAAAQRMDEESLLHATLDLPKFASLNWERGSVQLLSCTGDVIANLPIDGGVLRTFAAEFSPRF